MYGLMCTGAPASGDDVSLRTRKLKVPCDRYKIQHLSHRREPSINLVVLIYYAQLQVILLEC